MGELNPQQAFSVVLDAQQGNDDYELLSLHSHCGTSLSHGSCLHMPTTWIKVETQKTSIGNNFLRLPRTQQVHKLGISACCNVLCLVTQLCITLWDPMDYSPPGYSNHGDSPGKNTGAGCHALLQGIFPTQGLNPGLPHCRWILYYLSHQGSPRILEWVAYPFNRRSSRPRNPTGVSYIAGRFFTS